MSILITCNCLNDHCEQLFNCKLIMINEENEPNSRNERKESDDVTGSSSDDFESNGALPPDGGLSSYFIRKH